MKHAVPTDCTAADHEALAAAYREQTDDEHKKAWGQFFTSP